MLHKQTFMVLIIHKDILYFLIVTKISFQYILEIYLLENELYMLQNISPGIRIMISIKKRLTI